VRESGTRAGASGLLLALLLLAGCQGPDVDATRSGSEPVALRLGTPEGDSSPYATTVERFADDVAEATGGSVRIEVVWEADPDGWSPAIERRLAEMVAGGDLDLALVPTRAFDTLGVTTLRALQAPFLITDHELLAEVTRGELADDLLAGLAAADVVGLGLWPEELRRPVSYEEPLLTLADFDGRGVRVPTSETSFAIFRALGAEPSDPEDHGTAIHRGEVTVSESAFSWGPLLPQLGTFTANLTLYPKVNALVANPATYERLTVQQQQQVTAAASDAHEVAVAELPDEVRAAASYCTAGGGVAVASEDALSELREAVAPVYAELESDPSTAELIDRIRDVRSALPAARAVPPVTCEVEPRVADAPPLAVGEPDAPLPEGVLRTELTEDALREAGVPENYVTSYRGIYTMTFRDGAWFADGEEDEPGTYDFGGEYTIHGDVVTVSVTEPAHEAFCCEHYRWRVDGDVVTFDALVIEPLDLAWERSGGALLAGSPWTRIAP
jgi:TRAP-type C4-dicarboxylate transport system substrate-binding protein